MFSSFIFIFVHATPLSPQKLALTSPTSGGRSVGIVLSRTKATELVNFLLWSRMQNSVSWSRLEIQMPLPIYFTERLSFYAHISERREQICLLIFG
jgi:hypothetical protein